MSDINIGARLTKGASCIAAGAVAGVSGVIPPTCTYEGRSAIPSGVPL